VLQELDAIAPRTVVWLNEAQNAFELERYGEQLAAALKDLVHATGRGPILVVGTLWPVHWEELARRPEGVSPDARKYARVLLDGHTIVVPEDFSDAAA
jgi:hypothetical protein